MKPNIFLKTNYCNEDHFTTSLAYILNLFPASVLGNRFLDRIAAQAGYEPGSLGTFMEADFAGFIFQHADSTSKPDLVVTTTITKIFIEVKLQTVLSKNQLVRHLQDVDRVNGKLLFVSNASTHISNELTDSKNYIKPKNKSHFHWVDFEPVFDIRARKNSIEEQLMQDFRQLLRSNDIRGRQLVGASDNLYTKRSEAEKIALLQLQIIMKDIGFKASKYATEQTLRVYPVKNGLYPLLNPRFHSSGEFVNVGCINECVVFQYLIRGYSEAEQIKVDKLLELGEYDNTVVVLYNPLEEPGSDFYLLAHVYIELDFLSVKEAYDINWSMIKLVLQKMYLLLTSV